MAYHNQPQKTFVAKMSGVLIGCIVFFLLITANITVFGVNTVQRLTYPIFSLASYVSLADIIERVDIMWIAIWFMVGLISVSSLLYAAALGTAQVCNLRNFQTLLMPLGVIMASQAVLLMENTVQEMTFTKDIFPFFALSIEGGLTTLLFVMTLVKLFLVKSSR